MKKVPWRSHITRVRTNELVTRGVNQEKIIESFTYEEMVYYLILGKRPSDIEAMMLRAVILAHCSHGITGQSTLAVRMGADCQSPFLNAAVAGFLVGSGRVHQGGLEAAMKELQRALEFGDVRKYVEGKLANGDLIFGYGHRFHTYDPRAHALIRLCKRHSFLGPYVKAALQIDALLRRLKGLRMNIEGAGGSILLDMGFPVELAPLIILIGRGPMFAAAYIERLQAHPKPFPKIAVFDLV